MSKLKLPKFLKPKNDFFAPLILPEFKETQESFKQKEYKKAVIKALNCFSSYKEQNYEDDLKISANHINIWFDLQINSNFCSVYIPVAKFKQSDFINIQTKLNQINKNISGFSFNFEKNLIFIKEQKNLTDFRDANEFILYLDNILEGANSYLFEFLKMGCDFAKEPKILELDYKPLIIRETKEYLLDIKNNVDSLFEDKIYYIALLNLVALPYFQGEYRFKAQEILKNFNKKRAKEFLNNLSGLSEDELQKIFYNVEYFLIYKKNSDFCEEKLNFANIAFGDKNYAKACYDIFIALLYELNFNKNKKIISYFLSTVEKNSVSKKLAAKMLKFCKDLSKNSISSFALIKYYPYKLEVFITILVLIMFIYKYLQGRQ